MIVWPLKWDSPSHHLLCPTYKLAVSANPQKRSTRQVVPYCGPVVSPWTCCLPINDGIEADKFSMHYIHLDQIINMIAQLGPGAQMAKFDVEAAYRNIAVHPNDRYLLGIKWRGQFFMDLDLPFDLRSEPYIFNSAADLVEWIIRNKYDVADLMHYPDNFIMEGPADSLHVLKIYRLCWQSVVHLPFPLTPTDALAHPLVW